MAKKSRKPSRAAGIAVIDEATDDLRHEANGDTETTHVLADKPTPRAKKKTDQATSEHFGINDIKKAAAFVNSIGGLDKAIAVLQIVKVAKEVH